MKILLIDSGSCFLDFALRCEAAGHTVRVFMGPDKQGLRSATGDGLLHKVPDWRPSMSWADLIFCSDNAKYITALESYLLRGYPIWGSNAACASWELARGNGQRVLEAAGIATIPSVEFTNYDKAKAHVLAAPVRYVSKPDGDVDKALSYVSKGPADMLFMLDRWQREGKAKPAFLLQEFIPGIEMAVGGWFGRAGFAEFFLENFEFKKFMNGEIGVNTGEMGTAMKYVTAENSKLAREMLLPLAGELFRQGYTGYIDVAVIIDEKGKAWPLEFTTRPGWPLFQIQQVLHPEPCEWMLDSLTGTDSFAPSEDIALGVVVTIPDFPYSHNTKKDGSGFPVWGITDKNRYWIHPAEMQMGKAPVFEGGKITEKDMLVTAGDYVLICSGTGSSVSEAQACAYSVVKELEIPNSPMYRTDIGDRLEQQLPKLQALGYATTWEF